ncbi:MAG TPA: RNA polymerase sigma factor [Polyangiaceae bacterium]|nr:RNA polymerase sigma factor [Polyangiaceae bacterium]
MGTAPGASVGFGSIAWPVMVGRAFGCTLAREESLNEAMNRYAQGEQSAFAILYDGLEQKLRAFLTRLTGAPVVADDLLQETFMRIHRARGSFDARAAVVPWAYAIARNAWLDHVRAAKVRGEMPRATGNDDAAGSSDAPTGPDADSEQLAIARQTAALVESVLRRLAPAQREAFVLLRYEGMSVDDAAAVLGSTPTAVKLRAFRAYEALRAALGQPRAAPPAPARSGDRGGSDGR